MYSSDQSYSSFGVSGSDSLLGSTSSSSSSSASATRYKELLVRYKKSLALVGGCIVLALLLSIIVIVSSRSGDDNHHEPPPAVVYSSSSSSTSLPGPPAPASSTGSPGPPTPSGRLFSFSDAFNGSLTLSYSSLSWSPFDSSYVTTLNRDIVQRFPGSSEYVTLIPASVIVNCSLYSFSSDYTYFLFRRDYQSLYRHSGQALYFYVDRTQSPLSLTPLAALPLQYALFSPSLVSPAVVYVQSNNVYYVDLITGSTTAVTSDGEYNRIINGVCDWAYEEEVYGRSGVVWFSPSGRSVAFLKFNESAVPEYSFPLYSLPHNVNYRYKYPKVNDTNSIVSVVLFDVASGMSYEVDMGGSETEQYIINVQWIGEDVLGVKVMPRIQASWVLWGIQASDPLGARKRLNEQSHPFYLDTDFTLRYIPSLSGYLDTVIVNDHNHIALWDESGQFNRYVTSSAQWGVESLHCYDPTLAVLYVTASYPSSIERTVLAVDVDTGNWSVLVPTPSPTWQQASFSGNCSYFTLSEQANPAYLDTRLYRASPSLQYLTTLSDNKAKLDAIDSYTLPTQHHLTFPSATAPQYQLNAFFLLPPTFQGSLSAPDCSYRYPVLINVYGGPSNQMVSARYARGGNAGGGFATFLSGSKGYVGLVVDPVGTGGKGDTFQKNFTTGRLWQQEEVDVKAVIASLSQFCFIDTTRIAYWGWSYGGSMATRVATSPLPGAVNTVIAVAPVTDWRLYDSIYTERYMRRPTDNPAGYAATTLLTARARQLHVSSYLLVHGSADDNVHYQNSALLTEQLTRSQQHFQQFTYTNANHGMNGFFGFSQSNTQHLYRMIYAFLSTMVYGKGGDPAGVLATGESGRGEMMEIEWETEEMQAVMRERFFQA